MFSFFSHLDVAHLIQMQIIFYDYYSIVIFSEAKVQWEYIIQEILEST